MSEINILIILYMNITTCTASGILHDVESWLGADIAADLQSAAELLSEPAFACLPGAIQVAFRVLVPQHYVPETYMLDSCAVVRIKDELK